jgi:hypothetical protein
VIETTQGDSSRDESRRRWFSDDYFDLIVWEDEDGEIVQFRLCYGRQSGERALVWKRQSELSHFTVDDGEGPPGRLKMAPVLTADGLFDREAVAARFLTSSKDINRKISDFVYDKLIDKRHKL